MMIAENKKRMVQHNYLVQARFNCSWLEYKILVCLISQVDSIQDKELQMYQIPVGLITDVDSGSSYENVRNACERLLEKTIIIEKIALETDKKQEFVGFPVMQKCEYKKGTGFVLAQLNKELKPYLIGLTKQFTKVEMDELMKMDGFYAGRLYVLFKQYVTIGKRSLSMDEVRDMFNLRETKQMAKYKNINKYILKPAEQELLKTNLVVKRLDNQTIMNGKTVEKVVYGIGVKKEIITEATRLDYVIESPLATEWEKKLYNIGIKPASIRDIAVAVAKGTVEEGYINHCINHISKKQVEGKIYDIAGCVYDAIMVKRYLFEQYKRPKPEQQALTNIAGTGGDRKQGDADVKRHPLFNLMVKCGLNDWQMRDLAKKIPAEHKRIVDAKAYIRNDAYGDTAVKYAKSCYNVLIANYVSPRER